MSLPTAYQMSPAVMASLAGDGGHPGVKRKRSPEYTVNAGSGGGGAPSSGGGGGGNSSNPGLQPINYLVRSRSALKLVEADAEIFTDILATLDEYEGVLQRQESLAANLGAKLVGPLLLKSIEKLFDGPIKVFSVGDEFSTRVTWLDIVSLSRTDPAAFILNTAPQGPKACRFFVKGQGIEISEDDYRLLMSGAPERMLPNTPIPEDEAAELGTLNILEARLGTIIRKADAVASKARQLNYHLKQRKGGLDARKVALDPAGAARQSPQPQTFSPINTIRSTAPGQNGEAARLQQDLLVQFSTAVAPSPVTVDIQPGQIRRPAGTPSARPAKKHQSSHAHSSSLGTDVVFEGVEAAAAAATPANSNRRLPGAPQYDELIDGRFRLEMANRIEKLARGDPIYPPCDRCRRLKFDCNKHLTACIACTRKHAKCSWKDVREAELREPIPAASRPRMSEGPTTAAMDAIGPINVIQQRPMSDTASNGTSSSKMEGLEAIQEHNIKAEAESNQAREASREPLPPMDAAAAESSDDSRSSASPQPQLGDESGSTAASANIAPSATMIPRDYETSSIAAGNSPAPEQAPIPERDGNVDTSALTQMATAAVAAGSMG